MHKLYFNGYDHNGRRTYSRNPKAEYSYSYVDVNIDTHFHRGIILCDVTKEGEPNGLLYGKYVIYNQPNTDAPIYGEQTSELRNKY